MPAITTALPLARRGFLFAGGAAALALAGCASPAAAPAKELRVITSGGFSAAYDQLVPLYEQATGVRVVTARGASMGTAQDAIPVRLARGERFDIVILAGDALDALIAQGAVARGSRVDFARSTIGASVKKGTPKPDISTVAGLRQALLNAKSVAYSASASGTYFSTELVQKLGIAEQVLPKSKRILSERVGTVVARGDAELGLQQVSELVPIPGIDYIGPLPDEVQQATFFSAGIVTGAKEPEAARALIKFFTSAKAAPVIAKTGLEPVGSK